MVAVAAAVVVVALAVAVAVAAAALKETAEEGNNRIEEGVQERYRRGTGRYTHDQTFSNTDRCSNKG